MLYFLFHIFEVFKKKSYMTYARTVFKIMLCHSDTGFIFCRGILKAHTHFLFFSKTLSKR